MQFSGRYHKASQAALTALASLAFLATSHAADDWTVADVPGQVSEFAQRFCGYGIFAIAAGVALVLIISLFPPRPVVSRTDLPQTDPSGEKAPKRLHLADPESYRGDHQSEREQHAAPEDQSGSDQDGRHVDSINLSTYFVQHFAVGKDPVS